MLTIQPKGKSLRKTVKWISSERLENNKAMDLLIQKATLRFNPSPKEEAYLRSFYGEGG